ncbi:hypothetical protein CATYP_10290 [Corynebacterium atypicum]|uniref:Uncharacterized protein n=1 Tax=Corynebacterium atypicum TaxID=191610 RepID=A0ABM5QQ64_9CORY|nr:hypothetical protein [Corynebacterium atypicum]AIG64868.1 hypothetical protein CATYP_10290 [Corynebacterium atypicum]
MGNHTAGDPQEPREPREDGLQDNAPQARGYADQRASSKELAAEWLRGKEVASGEAARRLQAYRPTTVKKVCAGLGIATAILLLLPGNEYSSLAGSDMLSYWANKVSGAVFFALPAVYWWVCNHRDTKTIAAWAQATKDYASAWQFLSPAERRTFAQP